MYTLLIAIIYLAFISLGLPDSLLGASWPTIHEEMALPISYMGIISTLISSGTILSSLLSERIIKKIGTKWVVTFSVLITSMALFGFSVANSFAILCLIAIPYGLGAGAIDAALNNYVALHYSSRHMSWLHCFWGVGTIISPFVMSSAMARDGWQAGYRTVSVMQLVIFVILLIALPLWRVNSHKEQKSEDTKLLGIKGALKIRGVPYLLLGFMAYCATESTAMLWASSYLEESIGLTKTEAASFGALFFIGITAGRFLSGFISERMGDGKMIRIGSFIAFIGVILIAFPVGILPIIGYVIIGLGCAPIYPSIIHSTPTNFGAENSGAIIGIQMASAYLGSLAMPPLFGILAEYISIKLLPIYLGVLIILMFIMLTKTERVCSEK